MEKCLGYNVKPKKKKKKTKLRGNKGAKCMYTRLATRSGTLLPTQ